MTLGLRLPFKFDPQLLLTDLARVLPEEWVPHYNERDYGGEWTGVALRSSSGRSSDLIAKPANAGAGFGDTDVLARCPYLREVLAAFPCTLKAVRLLSLAPGSWIREHTDHELGFEHGEVRIHVPIQTGDSVEFYVCGERLRLDAGGCYYVNVDLPHRVNNRGVLPRVHLVIDAAVDDWVRVLFAERSRPIERSALPPGNLEEFRRFVMGDEAVRSELVGMEDRRALVARVVALGNERGFNLHEGDVDAGFRADPLRLKEVPSMIGPGATWMPVKARYPEADWLYTGGNPFTAPFYEDSVRRAQMKPFAALFRVTAPLPPIGNAVPPKGLIFHISRCGSTLVSQMLAAVPRLRVASEPASFDEVLRSELSDDLKIDGLRRIAYALGDVIKLDAWHIHQFLLIRAAFPETPWIFVWRDPVEVLVSHLRMPGMQTVPGVIDPGMMGLNPNNITQLTRAGWCASVIGSFCRRGLSVRDEPKGMFIDYRQLPEAAIGRLAEHFGLGASPEELELMRRAGMRDAKNPASEFSPDTAKKQQEAEQLTAEPAIDELRDLGRQLCVLSPK